jgi:hypothetical protein
MTTGERERANARMEGTKCPSCGCLAEHRTCFSCGTQAWVIDCGDYGQPAEIAADDQAPYEYSCLKCWTEAQEDEEGYDDDNKR